MNMSRRELTEGASAAPMPFSCPDCKSRNLRFSRIRTFKERLWTYVGVRPLRCRDCSRRFIERTWRITSVRYARCPRCWRLDLSRWSQADYHVPMVTRMLLALGASPFRCEYCRVNFVSFRQRKERYRAHRRRTPDVPTAQRHSETDPQEPLAKGREEGSHK
jgi:DNA-directed RNA polymerase subunit RPC12/RpoP